MNKRFFYLTVAVMTAMFFIACEKDDLAEDRIDIGIKTQYYWSGGQRIWLDTDSSVMIARFNNEQSIDEFLSLTPTASEWWSNPPRAVVWRQSESDKETFRKLETNQSVVSMVFGNLFHNSNTPFYLTGDIMFAPKDGISAESILQKFNVDGEIVEIAWHVTVRMNDWSTIFDVANAIHESGMVNWSHPDFWAPITTH